MGIARLGYPQACCAVRRLRSLSPIKIQTALLRRSTKKSKQSSCDLILHHNPQRTCGDNQQEINQMNNNNENKENWIALLSSIGVAVMIIIGVLYALHLPV